MSIDSEVMNAWREAGRDLGIDVTAPVSVQSTTGVLLQFEALILGFGSAGGTIVMTQTSQVAESKNVAGYHSVLLETYRTYDRKLFVDTLNDWGWFGLKDKAPIWYTGEPWTK